jgi:hypothetical protein
VNRGRFSSSRERRVAPQSVRYTNCVLCFRRQASTRSKAATYCSVACSVATRPDPKDCYPRLHPRRLGWATEAARGRSLSDAWSPRKRRASEFAVEVLLRLPPSDLLAVAETIGKVQYQRAGDGPTATRIATVIPSRAIAPRSSRTSACFSSRASSRSRSRRRSESTRRTEPGRTSEAGSDSGVPSGDPGAARQASE